jgi:hypothetical protein
MQFEKHFTVNHPAYTVRSPDGIFAQALASACLATCKGFSLDPLPRNSDDFPDIGETPFMGLQEAGAHFTSLGDSSSGADAVSPSMFAKFARPYQERLVEDLAADGIFTVIHVCGNTSSIVGQFAEYPWCGFELDYKTDAARAKATAGAGHVLFGNIDPSGIIGRGTVEQVRAAAGELIRIWKSGGRFILNSGCAIPPGTPLENIHALVRAAHEFGWYREPIPHATSSAP